MSFSLVVDDSRIFVAQGRLPGQIAPEMLEHARADNFFHRNRRPHAVFYLQRSNNR